MEQIAERWKNTSRRSANLLKQGLPIKVLSLFLSTRGQLPLLRTNRHRQNGKWPSGLKRLTRSFPSRRCQPVAQEAVDNAGA